MPVNELFDVRIKNEIIDVVNEVKYLGIILDKNVKFDRQVMHICKKVRPNLNRFCFIRRDLSNCTTIHACNDSLALVILHHIVVTSLFNHIKTYHFSIQAGNKNHGPETNEMAPL